MLDTESESTLIRGNFIRKLKLKERENLRKLVNISSSIKDTGEDIV